MALDPGSRRRGRESRTPIRSCSPTAPRRPARRARPAGGGEGRRACAEPAGGIRRRWAPTNGWSQSDSEPRPGAVREGTARRARAMPTLVSGSALAEQGLGRWDAARGASQTGGAPRSPVRQQSAASRRSASLLRRYPEAREALDRGLALAPANLTLIERKAMTFLGEGDLRRCPGRARGRAQGVEPTALVAYLATYWDLVWVLDEEQRELLLRLTPSAFDDDRGDLGPLPRSGLCA